MPIAVDPGLCVTCDHRRLIESGRGSRFWMCELHRTEPRFPKYPRLPVVRCDGYLASLATPE